MKIGDILVCHTTGRMNLTGDIFCTEGKKYVVTELEDRGFRIIDDKGENHGFSDSEDNTSYKKWFYKEDEHIESILTNLIKKL